VSQTPKGGVSLGSVEDFRSDIGRDGWTVPKAIAPKASKVKESPKGNKN